MGEWGSGGVREGERGGEGDYEGGGGGRIDSDY